MIRRICFSLVLLCALEGAELTLYYSPHCPYSKQVLSHLKQMDKQVPLKNVMQDPLAKEELKKWGRLEVPCLSIDGQPLYNSDAIIEWLDDHTTDF